LLCVATTGWRNKEFHSPVQWLTLANNPSYIVLLPQKLQSWFPTNIEHHNDQCAVEWRCLLQTTVNNQHLSVTLNQRIFKHSVHVYRISI